MTPSDGKPDLTLPPSPTAPPNKDSIAFSFTEVLERAPIPTESKWVRLDDDTCIKLIPFIPDRDAVAYARAAQMQNTNQAAFANASRHFMLTAVHEDSRPTFNKWLAEHPMPGDTVVVFADMLFRVVTGLPLDDASESSESETESSTGPQTS